MRTSAFFTTAFVATALGAPSAVKRSLQMETVYDTVYVTNLVTETLGASVSSVHGHRHSRSSRMTSAAGYQYSRSSKTSAAAQMTTATSVTIKQSPSSVYAPPATTTKAAATSAPYVPNTKPAATTAAAQTTPAAPSSYAAQTSNAAGGYAASYSQLVLAHHNVHRANHSSPPIAWDDNLASVALSIAKTCVYGHDTAAGGGGYGQNIAAGVRPADIGTTISDLFYNGEVEYFTGYGQAQPDMSDFNHWGHFSQIVWKSTTHVGCATFDCSADGLANVGGNVPPYFTVCNYGPPGNYPNQYDDNVGSCLGHSTVTGSQPLQV